MILLGFFMFSYGTTVNGDPFLIATAILEDGIIVTDEGNKNNGIPMVCESLGLEYMKLNDMLDEVLE